jgi:hypothetical protein
MRRLAAYLFFAAAALWFSLGVVRPAAERLTHGFGAYYAAARLLLDGRMSAQIYDPDYFRPLVRAATHGQAEDIFNANPPTTTLLFAPLAPLTVEMARRVWMVLSALLLLAGLGLLVWVFGGRPFAPTLALVGGVGLLFQPVASNFEFGQAYALLFFLLSVATAAFVRQRDAVGGLALAVALLLKPAAAILLLVLLWVRRWRFIALTVGVAAATVLLTLPVFPLSMWRAYGQLLAEAGRGPWVCVTAYQTSRSLLCHLLRYDAFWNPQPVADAPWLATALYLLLGLVTLAAILALGRRRPVAAFVAAVAWSVLLAPLGEQYHHIPMLIPTTWLIVKWQHGRLPGQSARLALLLGVLLYVMPYPFLHPRLNEGWMALLAYPRLAAGWLILLAVYDAGQRPMTVPDPSSVEPRA